MNLDRDKYYSLISNHPDAFAYHQIVTDDNGNPVDYIFLEVNNAFEEMTGLSRNKVIGKRVTEILPDITNSEFDWIGTYGQVALSGKAARFESFSEPLGRWYEVTAYSDEPGSFVTLFRDVSEQKKAREKLELSEENYRSLIDNAPDTIARFDHSLRHVFINKKAVAELGQPVEHFIGKTNHELGMPESVVKEWEAGLLAAFQEKKEQIVDIEIETPNGFSCYTSRIVPEFAPDGTVNTVLSITRNITERKQAEEEVRVLNAELEQRVKERTTVLEALNKELAAFAYSVSHDFRAPLRALDAFSANLTNQYSDQLDEQGLHYLNRIRHNAQYLSGLIDDMLKLSRITRADVNLMEVDISGLALKRMKLKQEKEPKHRVKVEVAPGLSARGDMALLEDALEYLIDNAWKFSSKEAQAKIEVGRMTINGEEAFFVRDNGVGFKMAYADKLFGIFQRLHGVNEFPGTGIGLATVQRIINLHGGRIWAESEVGKGATFYFTLKS